MGSWGKRTDMIVHENEPFNAEPPPHALANAALTPIDAFYTRNHGQIPTVEEAEWQVRVDGLVDRPSQFSLADLKSRFAEHTVTATLQCAGNRRAGLVAVRDIPGEDPWGDTATSTAEWTGVRLADVLATVGVDGAAAHVAFDAPDLAPLADPPQPYGASIPLHKAISDEVLLAWAMNGVPLPAIHGGPLRVVVPGYIGARSVKWVDRITVRSGPSDNYFQQTAYRLLPPDGEPGPGVGLSLGPVALNSAILAPADGDTVAAGPVTISGYAFAGDGRGVARVEVSDDGGRTWQQAQLGASLGPWAWRMWHLDTVLEAGERELVARAWDGTAALQPESPVHVWNPKGYVNNSWPRNAVHVTPVPG